MKHLYKHLNYNFFKQLFGIIFSHFTKKEKKSHTQKIYLYTNANYKGFEIKTFHAV